MTNILYIIIIISFFVIYVVFIYIFSLISIFLVIIINVIDGAMTTTDRFEKVPLVTPNGDILVKELTFEVPFRTSASLLFSVVIYLYSR